MPYVIKKIVKYEKEYIFYFSRFSFAIELSNLEHAMKFDLKTDALNQKKIYFGNAKNVSVIKI